MNTYRDIHPLLRAAAVVLILLVPSAGAVAGDDWGAGTSAGTLLSAGESGYPDIPARGPDYLFPRNQEYRFLSFQVGQRSMGGDDFEGDTFYSSDTELFMIPDMKDAPSYGVYLDFRQGYLGGGIGYSYSSHEWSFLGAEAEDARASAHFVDFNIRLHLLADRPIQPFGLLGFSLNGIRVEDGKHEATTDSLKNLSMWGFGLNWGAGVDFYPSRRFKLTGGARWHVNGYNSISGNDLDEGLSNWGVNYFLSLGVGIG